MNEHPRRDADDRLADWVDGRMSDKERERFVAELRVNPQLRQDLEQYERTVGVVRAALRAPSSSSTGAGVADRVMAAIAAGAAPAAPRRAGGAARAGVWWSVAAAAALLAIAVAVDRFGPPQPAKQDTAAVDSPRFADADKKDGEKLDAGSAGAASARDEKPGQKPDEKTAETDRAPSGTDLRKVEEQVAVVTPDQAAAPRSQPGNEHRSDDFYLGSRRQVQVSATPPPGGSPQPAPAVTPAAPPVPEPKLAGGKVAPAANAPGGDAGQLLNLGAPATGGTDPAAKTGAVPADPRAADGGTQLLEERLRAGDAERRDASVPMIVLEGVEVAPKLGATKSLDGKDQTKEQRARGGAPTAPSGGGGGAGEGKSREGAKDDRVAETLATLDTSALAARVDAFLADAAAPSAAATAVAWPTERGELRLSPLVEEPAKKAPAPEAPADKFRSEKPAAPVVERTWLIEGATADVELVLARITRFAQQHKLSHHAGDTAAPSLLRGYAAGAPVAQGTASGLAAADDRRAVQRVVLRFRLRPR